MPVKSVLSLQYFLYFGVLGIFLPYFNLYCHHLGFSGNEIGTLSAAKSLVLVLCSIAWGGLADRFGIRGQIYIFCAWASAVETTRTAKETRARCFISPS